MTFVPQREPFLLVRPIVIGMGINDLFAAVDRRWTDIRGVRCRNPVLPTLAAIWTVIIYLAACLLGAIVSAEAGETQELGVGAFVVPRVDQPITLDGQSDEPAWQGVLPLEMIMFQPSWGGPPSERTEFLVAYDDKNFYVAGRLYDREPDRIQGNSMERDSSDASSDWFGVVIDTFNDKQNALSFFTTPTGLRWDAEVKNDHEGPGRRNQDWNSFWDVAVVRTDEGWFAELRIPFSTLRFQPDSDGRVVMGLIVRRSIARNEEWDVYPDVPGTWGFSGLFKPSQGQPIELRDIGASRKRFFLAPYTLVGRRWLEFDGAKTAGLTSDEQQVGLDLKYLMSSNVTLDLTFNPDFAQVEADDVRVNLTRFPLFYPEKRPFFQERASTFELNFSNGDRVFHSRRIGIADGRVVRIVGGARVVGRSGPWDFGILDVQTESSESRGGENAGVFRVRRRVVNENSSVGAIVTSRIGGDDGANYVLGLDGNFRVADDDYLTIKWVQSVADDEDAGLDLDRMRLQGEWERRTIEGIGYGFRIDHAGVDYRPGLGVRSRTASTWAYGELRYGRMPAVPSPLYSDSFKIYAFGVRRHGDGALDSARLATEWVFETRTGWSGRVSPRFSHEDLAEPFELAPGVVIPAGDYRTTWFKGVIRTPSGSWLSGSINTQFGEFYDGSFASLALGANLRPGSRLEVFGDVELNRARFPQGRARLDSRIVRVRALYAFSSALSASVLAQYSNIEDAVSFNTRLRYNPREGVDVWLVYDEVSIGGFADSPPVSASVEGRSVMLKFCYTFVG